MSFTSKEIILGSFHFVCHVPISIYQINFLSTFSVEYPCKDKKSNVQKTRQICDKLKDKITAKGRKIGIHELLNKI